MGLGIWHLEPIHQSPKEKNVFPVLDTTEWRGHISHWGMIGGSTNGKTTDLVKTDGTVMQGFNLKYDTRYLLIISGFLFDFPNLF